MVHFLLIVFASACIVFSYRIGLHIGVRQERKRWEVHLEELEKQKRKRYYY